MIALVMLGGVLNYLTRNTLSVAQVRLQDTLHITEQQYSWITATFQFAIMLQPIVGYVLEHFRRAAHVERTGRKRQPLHVLDAHTGHLGSKARTFDVLRANQRFRPATQEAMQRAARG